MKTLSIGLGDCIIHHADTGEREGQQIIYEQTTYDVIRVNKKTVVLQAWPTGQKVKLRVKK